MMNETYNFSHDNAIAPLFSNAQSHTCVETADEFMCPLSITDEEAELQLPGYALAFEEYHKRRVAGLQPEEALEDTLKEWRAMWRQGALVPHRPPSNQ